MHISVNKNTVAKRPMKYAALASGTVSHVWSEDEQHSNKRKVYVTAKAMSPQIKAPRNGK
jgi:hypothetical protein